LRNNISPDVANALIPASCCANRPLPQPTSITRCPLLNPSERNR
jgi:hypothetical protein